MRVEDSHKDSPRRGSRPRMNMNSIDLGFNLHVPIEDESFIAMHSLSCPPAAPVRDRLPRLRAHDHLQGSELRLDTLVLCERKNTRAGIVEDREMEDEVATPITERAAEIPKSPEDPLYEL